MQKVIEDFLRATHQWFVFVEGSIQDDGNGSRAAEFRDQFPVLHGWPVISSIDGSGKSALKLVERHGSSRVHGWRECLRRLQPFQFFPECGL
jgi:hypothetical protein